MEWTVFADRVGIIPARAGFTVVGGHDDGGAWDHPRSRGVYRSWRDAMDEDGGSSPLARGLRRALGAQRGRAGIIPARAGFTCTYTWVCTPRADHPRSRGVYPTRSTTTAPSRGSSPLARGLLTVMGPGRDRVRIIPARAGFTADRAQRGREPQDHPRSRGVYSTARVRGAVSPGSSPLARGLRRSGGRAGGLHGGSSPLARGLQLCLSTPITSSGIIPARAGFTHVTAPCCRCCGDHPRSRGVYWPPP